MLDRYTHAIIQPLLKPVIKLLLKKQVHSDRLTWIGFVIGLFTLPALALKLYFVSLVLILVNRVFDGLDGALARATSTTDKGGFLDITLDFIFYSIVVLGFALAKPEANALPSAFLLFAFMGATSSFLAFAIMAEKNNISCTQFKNKSLFYMSGLTEGTETIIFFMLACMLPSWFPFLACFYAVLCLITTAGRIINGCAKLS